MAGNENWDITSWQNDDGVTMFSNTTTTYPTYPTYPPHYTATELKHDMAMTATQIVERVAEVAAEARAKEKKADPYDWCM